MALKARKVSFDWQETPLHWVPGDPFATHTINVPHLLLPAGERWFVHVYQQVLPYITDEELRADVIGFIGQEAMHSQAHDEVLPHLKKLGLDPTPYTAQVDWLFEKLLGDRTLPPGRAREWWLMERVALIAAIEHYTAFLGNWVLNADELDRRGADATMLDLQRRHGAEEVEHRSVAFELFLHVDGGYRRRVRTWATAFSALVFLWQRGARFFMENDPSLRNGRASLPQFVRAGRQGVLPSTSAMLRSVPRCPNRSYPPVAGGQHGAGRRLSRRVPGCERRSLRWHPAPRASRCRRRSAPRCGTSRTPASRASAAPANSATWRARSTTATNC